MAKNIPALKPPSKEAVEILFRQAHNAPLQNFAHAKQVETAINEVGAFFMQLLQINDSGPSVKPQASDNAAGN